MESLPISPSASPALPSPPSRRLRWIAVAVRGLLWLVAAAWLLFGLSWGVLHGWIVPRIAEFRPQLEAQASRALGVPVRIGRITGKSLGAIPSFELHDVVLLDAQGREAVRLPHVLGALSPSSLWGLGFEQLVIERPEVDIRRAADGKIFVGGLDVSKDTDTGHSAVADWLFSQTEFVVRGGTLRWTDEMRPAPPLALGQVDAVMRNSRHRHLMRLDATPPAEWGERFSLRAIFRQPLLSRRNGDFLNWSGQVYGEFSRVDVSRVQQYAGLEKLGIALNRGQGALRAWSDVSKGKVTGALVDVALQGVDARLGADLEPLAFNTLAGRVAASQHDGGFDVSTEGLQFSTRDGLQWPGGNLALVHANASRQAPAHTTLKADRLDLAALARIAGRLPLEPSAHALVASLAPRGLVETLDARWQGPLDGPSAYAAKGRVTDLSVAAGPAAAASGATAGIGAQAVPGRPGLSGATVDFNLTQDGGQASVKIAKGALDLPGIFEESRLPMDQLSVQAQWKSAGEKIDLQLRDLKFENADAQGQAQVRWRTDDAAAGPPEAGESADRRFPGILDLQGSLSRGDGSRVHRYLPLVLDPEVRHYVRDAVIKGQVSDVKFKVRGPVWHLPFANPALGDFQVSAKVRNGHLVYVPKALQPPGAAPWPALTELNGELLFSRASLDVKVASGKVAGLPGLQLLKGDARIANLEHQPAVEVAVEVRGALSDALGFVNSSPLGAMTEHALADATATGAADYRFRLRLPIDAIDTSTVEGTVTLPGNDLKFLAQAPLLGQVKGVVNVTDQGFSVAGAQARLLGGDVRIDGGTRPLAPVAGARTSVAFKAQGTVTADGLRQATELGLASRVAAHLSGSTAYSATLQFRQGVPIPEIMVSSSLQGMALNLPAPLAKTAETALPVRFENQLVASSMDAGQTLQDQLSLSIGRVAVISYLRDLSGNDVRVLRGSIGVGLEAGESTPAPPTGVGAHVNLAALDLDAWEGVLGQGASVAQPAASAPAGLADAMGYLPNVMAIRAKQLKVQGRSLNNVVVGASRDGLNWRANIDAAELDGYLEFRQPGAQGAGRVYARLSRLSLAASEASEVEAMLDEQPASIPALDIVVENLELRGKKLGRVEIEAINRGAAPAGGGVREWQLNKFNVILPEAVLTATGSWAALPTGPRAARPLNERRRASMDFRLDIADSGELLGRFGMSGVIRRGKGTLQGQVAWMGSPLSLDYPSLNGEFHVNVASGQFMKADPGIAKLLGVLSLQSLPRRLTLDFRDVFSQGFAFDFIRGDVTIVQGVAQTNNLQMSGVNAAVLMEGRAGIADETQSLKVVVVPEINAGTASLIATAINPVVGLGSFLAQMFLRRPLMEAATQEFQIDGSWYDPIITKVDRKARARAQAGETTVETRKP
ncbi:YhdP family protein [Polaromonas sp.]|uniref:YhdP family protein n=1 Tax=Polaromonas sp. TaxID=1869339 RepID=UPI0013B7F3DC|nr:YhdP family protein [Polaromonas sp.]NDP62492.1 TIGR02099 family protein [Polaromonas sp.]